MNEVNFVITESALTLFFPDGETKVIHRESRAWDDIMEALRAEEWEDLRSLANRSEALMNAVNTVDGSGITIDNGKVYLDGEELPTSYSAEKILQFVRDDLPMTPLINFLRRVVNNNSFRVRRDLMEFLDKNELPITSDGHFLAYKYVRADGFDQHSGTVKYTVGEVTEMPRWGVDDDPNNTCSQGLHVAGRHYFGSGMGSGCKFLSIKVDPQDVVSIPTDYNHSKMRVCKLFVVAEIDPPEENNIWGEEVVDDDLGDYEYDYAD